MNTSLTNTKSGSEPLINQVGKRKKLDADVEEDSIQYQLKEFKVEVMEMLKSWKTDQDQKFQRLDSTLRDIRQTHQEIEKSIEFIGAQVEDMGSKVSTLEKMCKINEDEIVVLKEEIENLHRNSRIACLELRNVPSKPKETKEDLTAMVENLCKTLKVNISAGNIKDIYRIPGKAGKPGPILTEMSGSMVKQTILKASKDFNIKQHNNETKLNASYLGLDSSEPIYIAEHLTAKANRLLFLARDFAKTNSYKFCWTTNGKVFMRKAEGSNMILVKSEAQIQALKVA